MALKLLNRIPLVRNVQLLQKYDYYLRSAEFKVDPLLWIGLSIIFSVLAGLGAWFVTFSLIGIPQHIQIGVLFFIVVVDLMIGYPYLKAEQRIDAIEEALPDALRQMADTLKAGGTYEYAMREIAMAEYGPLTKEINEVLRKLEEGENFENAFNSLAENVDSRIVKRTITIIIDSVRAGAGLADVLEEISDDVREAHRINKERKTRTVMQAIFMVVAGGIVSPIIFGFVSTVSNVLITAAGNSVSEELSRTATEAANIIQLSIQAFIFIQVLATSIMISVMREGKISKSIIYYPILLFIAYLVYIAASIISGAIVGLR